MGKILIDILSQSWKVICLRIIANLSVLFLLCVSAYAVIFVVKRSSDKTDSWWRRNEITIVMSMISFLFPMLFELLGLMEYYHPRMQLRLQLARIMILNLLNLYSLIWALFGKITDMTKRLGQIKNFSQDYGSSKVPPSLTTPMVITQTPSTTSTIPSTMIQSITETVFSRISDIVNQTTTEFPNEPTEYYDYSNTNYFDSEETTDKSSIAVETSTAKSFLNFTESLLDFTDPFYIDNDSENLTNFYSNTTDDLLENSNFNMSNFINDSSFNDSIAARLTSSVFNDSIASSLTSSVFNYTNVDALQSFLNEEKSAFINMDLLNMSTKAELRKLCWETMFGQELVKLTVMDLVSRVFSAFHPNFQLCAATGKTRSRHVSHSS